QMRLALEIELGHGQRPAFDPASAQAEPACDVRACSRAYRSFRASDCTFQPYSGPRKLCTR
ncbi:BA14K family protein, partial [Limimaricola sp. ASW11-118]